MVGEVGSGISRTAATPTWKLATYKLSTRNIDLARVPFIDKIPPTANLDSVSRYRWKEGHQARPRFILADQANGPSIWGRTLAQARVRWRTLLRHETSHREPQERPGKKNSRISWIVRSPEYSLNLAPPDSGRAKFRQNF